MEYRLLGRSGLKVSTITLGTMTMGGKGDFAMVGNVGVKEARRQIDLCIDAGVNLIDTADVYSAGASEEIIGQALGGKRKGGVLIATKARFAMGEGPNDGGHLAPSSDPRLRGQPEAARHRCHRSLPAPSMGRRDAAGGDARGPRQSGPARARALHRLLELFRLACDEGARRQRAVSIASASSASRSTTRWRRARPSTSCCPSSIDQGLGILVWSPIAGGLLSGKHRRNQKTPAGTRQLAGWTEPPIRDENRLWNIVEALVAIGEARGVSAAQVALAWLLGRPGITSLVIGGRTEAQLKDNLAAAALALTPEERQRLDEVSQLAAALPLLAPAQFDEGPPQPRRLGAAGAVSLGLPPRPLIYSPRPLIYSPRPRNGGEGQGEGVLDSVRGDRRHRMQRPLTPALSP